MARCLIALGSNQGDRQQTLDWTLEQLRSIVGIEFIGRSRWHETRPVGGPSGQPAFLNGAVVVETSLSPEQLLTSLQRLENAQGRHRSHYWGPRTLDLDILLYGEKVFDTPTLAIPHPRMAWRRFVLEPAAEVAPEMVHPATGWTIRRLLQHLNEVRPYVALTGIPGQGKTHLAEQLAQSVGCQLIAHETVPPCPLDSSGDSSSINWHRELEFLAARTRLLAVDRVQGQTHGPWVSDFWFGQSLAYAALCLKPEQQETFRQKWDEARRRVMPPKLIVLLETPAERLSDAPARLQREIRVQVSRPEQGPVLRLTGASTERALIELRAAIESMK